MMSIQQNKKNQEYRNEKKILLISSENINDNENHHRKAKTQNINIYKIIHGNKPQIIGESKVNGHKTPLELFRNKEENKHETQLEDELKMFRAEIEFRYSNSNVNKKYSFPRKVFVDKFKEVNSSERIPMSIYDDTIMNKELNEGHSKSIITKKSRSQERSEVQRLHMNGNLKKFMQNILNNLQIKEESKIKKEKFKYDSNLTKCDYYRNTASDLIAQKTMKFKQNWLGIEKKQKDNSLLLNISSEGYYPVKKIHYRTRTFNGNENKGIKIGNSKDKMNHKQNLGAVKIANYFQRVFEKNNAKSRLGDKTVLRIKTKKHDKLNSTLSQLVLENNGGSKVGVSYIKN